MLGLATSTYQVPSAFARGVNVTPETDMSSSASLKIRRERPATIGVGLVESRQQKIINATATLWDARELQTLSMLINVYGFSWGQDGLRSFYNLG
jgi:hypothetical protein